MGVSSTELLTSLFEASRVARQQQEEERRIVV
jgi:hypothetical protein